MKILLDILKKTLIITFIGIQFIYLACISLGGTIMAMEMGHISGLQCFLVSFPIIPLLVSQKYLFPLYYRFLK